MKTRFVVLLMELDMYGVQIWWDANEKHLVYKGTEQAPVWLQGLIKDNRRLLVAYFYLCFQYSKSGKDTFSEKLQQLEGDLIEWEVPPTPDRIVELSRDSQTQVTYKKIGGVYSMEGRIKNGAESGRNLSGSKQERI